MRITGGLARGIPLLLPARGEIRPATDYLRGAVFSSLAAFVPGARVLDLFAGTGAYGLEALSRGAAAARFIEKNPAATAVIRVNAAAVAKALQAGGAPAPAHEIIQADALRPENLGGDTGSAGGTDGTGGTGGTGAVGGPFDLIFCDPPWELWQTAADAFVAAFAALAASGPDARLVLEAPGGCAPPVPPGWVEHRRLAKGKGQPAAFILRPLEKAE
jgi:16S rRNA (guanine966-N2)-methyltransferase